MIGPNLPHSVADLWVVVNHSKKVLILSTADVSLERVFQRPEQVQAATQSTILTAWLLSIFYFIETMQKVFANPSPIAR